jgi:hypothetical protein
MTTPETPESWTPVSYVDDLYEGSVTGREAHVQALINVAERRLVKLVRDLRERVDSGAVDLADVRDVVAQAVIRYMRNPAGLTQSSITEGPWTRSDSYAAAAAAQAGVGITFTEDELDALRAPGALPEGIGVIHQGLPAWRVP